MSKEKASSNSSRATNTSLNAKQHVFHESSSVSESDETFRAELQKIKDFFSICTK